MAPEQFLPRATIFAIACCVGVALFSTSNARPQDDSAKQVRPRTGDTNFEHKYRPVSMWVACGYITDDAYEGRTSQEGHVWKCDDGATIYDVRDNFTTAHAAEAERLTRLQEKRPERNPWRIARTEPLGDATIIEFTEPVSVGSNVAAPCQWAVIWTRDKALSLIYGPDREHVMDFYQTRYVSEAKK